MKRLGLFVLATLVGCSHEPPVPSDPVYVDTSYEGAPPLSGGTMLLTSGGLVIASDPSRLAIWIVQPNVAIVGKVDVLPGDDPGRIAESSDGRVHVALRGSGDVLSFDPASPDSVERWQVCAGPRGLAFDPAKNLLHVACVRGELVSVPLDGGPERRLLVGDDVRDVVVEGNGLWLSYFRSAKVALLEAETGKVIATHVPTAETNGFGGTIVGTSAVAWRMTKALGAGVLLSYQIAKPPDSVANAPAVPAYYGTGQSPLVIPAVVSLWVGAGSIQETTPSFPTPGLTMDASAPSQYALCLSSDVTDGISAIAMPGNNYGCYYQTRDLVAGVPLPFLPVDVGSRDFHAGPGMACASCHPEGRDDGITWQFGGVPRRTQSLTGDVTGTAPFHWNGDLDDVKAFMDEVMVTRMARTAPSDEQVDAMTKFLARIPKLPPPPDLDGKTAELGRALFESEEVGCANCHSGPQLTDSSNQDVGTGNLFQVPRLVDVSARGPFLHDGCAATLMDRFLDPSCGGGDAHGATSQLTKEQLGYLVEYLRSL